MAVPSRGEVFSALIHNLREAQSNLAMMAHLHNTEGNDTDKQLARGWLIIEELMRKMIHKITLMGQGRLN